jgi:hypothetical protein
MNWLVGSSSSPRVLGSTTCGSEFQTGVKNILSSAPRQSIGLKPSLGLTWAMVPLCKGRVGVQGFS